MSLLAVKKLTKHFGGVKAVHHCKFTVKPNSITALIGPNGAGKTTVFNLVSRLLATDKGTVSFKAIPILDLKPHQVAQLGVARTFQLIRIFPKLSCIENLMIAHPGMGEGMFDRFIKRKLVKEEEKRKQERALELLGFVGLKDKANTKAGDLSYGQQKLLDIARCLATEAELLLLDEPVAGVNPIVRERIKKLLRNLKKEGKTILLIEHDMSFVMDLCDEIVVLDHGEEIAVGTPKQIQKNKKVINAYLGESS